MLKAKLKAACCLRIHALRLIIRSPCAAPFEFCLSPCHLAHMPPSQALYASTNSPLRTWISKQRTLPTSNPHNFATAIRYKSIWP